PSAWRATLPVSRVSGRPPQSSSTRCISNIASFSHVFRRVPKAMSKTARSCCASPQSGKQQRLAILPWRSNLARSSGRTFSSATVNVRGVLRRRTECECEMHSLTKHAEFPARTKSSTANVELLDQGLVTFLVRPPQVIEQRAALAHHLERATPVMVVQRRTLLDYLRRTDEKSYKTLIEKLNIR